MNNLFCVPRRLNSSDEVTQTCTAQIFVHTFKLVTCVLHDICDKARKIIGSVESVVQLVFVNSGALLVLSTAVEVFLIRFRLEHFVHVNAAIVNQFKTLIFFNVCVNHGDFSGDASPLLRCTHKRREFCRVRTICKNRAPQHLRNSGVQRVIPALQQILTD